MRRQWIITLFVAFMAAFGLRAHAQEDESNGFIVNLIEETLSSENQTIKLRGIDGLLASDARIDEITVADRDGVWLSIKDADITWTRRALFSKQLKINKLKAGSIEITRRPLPSKDLPTLEAEPFSLPQLPVSVEIDALEVSNLIIGEPVFGVAATMQVNGKITLADGSLATRLDVVRLDAPKGKFALDASYVADTRQLAVDLELHEDKGGFLSTLLKIEGAPSLDLTVKGAGPIDALDVSLFMAADGEPAVNGDLTLRDSDGGIGFEGRLNGQIARLLAPAYRPFFEGQSRINVSGRTLNEGGFFIEQTDISTASMQIAGQLSTTQNGFLKTAKINGQIGGDNGPTALPFKDVTIRKANLAVDFGQSPDGKWQAELTGIDLRTPDVNARDIVLRLSGVAENLEDAEARRVTVNGVGDLSGLRARTPDLSRALGQRVSFQLASDWERGVYTIERARVTGNASKIELEGRVEDFAFNGQLDAEIDRLSPFGGLTGRDLRGGLDVSLDGFIAPLKGSFDLDLSGTSQSLKLDIPQLDPLLAGKTDLSGRVIRDETGIETRKLRLSNEQVLLTSDGRIASDKADFTFDAVLVDLSDVTDRASGQLKLGGSISGAEGIFDLNTKISSDQVVLLNKPLDDAVAQFEGQIAQNTLTGKLSGYGWLDREAISIGVDLRANAETQSANELRVSIGPTSVTGELERASSGLFSGQINMNSPDISLPATLFLQEAKGRARLAINLNATGLGQQIITAGDLSDLEVAGLSIAQAKLDAHVENAFGIPTIAGSLDFGSARFAGIDILSGNLSAGGRDGRTNFNADVNFTQDNKLNLVGSLTSLETGYEIELSRLDLQAPGPIVTLSQKAALRVEGERVEVQTLNLRVSDGEITAKGRIDENFDIFLGLDAVPLAIANTLRADLGLSGALSGTAKVTGPRDAPNVDFQLDASSVSASSLQAVDLPAFDVSARGITKGSVIELETAFKGPNNLDSTLQGTIGISDQEMNLKGQLNSFPLAVIDAAIGRQGLRGNATGSFNLLGTPAKPRVNFELEGRSISTAIMRDNVVSALSLNAVGSFVNNTLTLPELRVSGSSGMNFSMSGRIPLQLDGLNVAVEGQVPMAVANVAFAKNGLSASGVLDLSMRATGRLGAPQLSGSAQLNDGTFVSSQANLRLVNVDVDAVFEGNRLVIRNARAGNSRGGAIDLSGALTIDADRGLPVDLSAAVSDFRYTDGKLATAEASGTLALTGALLGKSLLSGAVEMRSLEISIPQRIGAKKAYSLDVRHINTPPRVAETLRRAGLKEAPTPAPPSESDIAFDVDVNAPIRVFVRGRGVDAELGGSIKLGGTTSNLKPVGQFNLIRGRINILARRIELDEGYIRMNGTTDPEIYMRARTVTDDVEANVVLEGPASRPELSFSSVPDLPDDEILARLVFDRALSDLSALQVAQLAAAAGEISGRTGPSFFSQLRNATGLDDLDFETDNSGKTTVRIGKYIQDNIYSSLEADNRGSSRATINLDINARVKAKGTLDNAGNTSFGIFYEKDY